MLQDDPRDRLEHYMRCDIRWKFIATVIDGAEYRESLLTVQKACFVEPALNDLKTICVAFKAYHALKMGHRELINKAINSNKFDRVHVLLLEYLRCFASESSLRLYAS